MCRSCLCTIARAWAIQESRRCRCRPPLRTACARHGVRVVARGRLRVRCARMARDRAWRRSCHVARWGRSAALHEGDQSLAAFVVTAVHVIHTLWLREGGAMDRTRAATCRIAPTRRNHTRLHACARDARELLYSDGGAAMCVRHHTPAPGSPILPCGLGRRPAFGLSAARCVRRLRMCCHARSMGVRATTTAIRSVAACGTCVMRNSSLAHAAMLTAVRPSCCNMASV